MILAFLILLLVLSWTGHETIAGILLVGFVALVMVLGHLAERDRTEKLNGWRWPANKE